jgi:hypothetical protein
LRTWAAVGAAIGQLLQYGWRFLKNLFLPKAVLAARVLAAESQLALCLERLESQVWVTKTSSAREVVDLSECVIDARA